MRELPWTNPEIVKTPGGEELFEQTLDLSDPWNADVFRPYWKRQRAKLKSLGFGLRRNEQGEPEAFRRSRTWQWPGEEPAEQKSPREGKLPEYIERTWEGGGLLPPQIDHVKRLVRALRANDCAVDLSDTGVGKTPCSLMTAKTLGKSVVVICPKSVISSWENWFQTCGVQGYCINYEKAIRGHGAFIELTNRKSPGYKQFRWTFGQHRNEFMVVIDEAHRAKGRDTKQGKLVAALKLARIPVLLLSATLAESPLDMKNTGYLLDFHGYGNFYDWAARLGCINGKYGWFYPREAGTMGEVHRLLFPHRGSRLRRTEMSAFFPENRVISRPIDVGDKSNKLYAELQEKVAKIRGDLAKARGMSKALKERAEARGDDEYVDPYQMVETLRLQQEIEMLKVPSIKELAKDMVDEGSSVVIFVQFRESLEEIRKGLKGLELHGGQNGRERSEVIRAFQADENPVIVVQIQAGGVGVSFHQENGSMRPRRSILNPVFSAEKVKQAMGRIDRAASDAGDREYRVDQYFVYDKNSEVEARICDALSRKAGNINELNDGDLAEVFEI